MSLSLCESQRKQQALVLRTPLVGLLTPHLKLYRPCLSSQPATIHVFVHPSVCSFNTLLLRVHSVAGLKLGSGVIN